MQTKELQTFLNQQKHIPKSACRPADRRSLYFPRSLAQGWLCSEPRVSVKDQSRAGVHCSKAPATLLSHRVWLLLQLMTAEPFLQPYIHTAIWEQNGIRAPDVSHRGYSDISETSRPLLRALFWPMSLCYCRLRAGCAAEERRVWDL